MYIPMLTCSSVCSHYPVSSSSSGSAVIQQGDMVEVIEGSLANLQGKVLSVTGDTALIMPKHEDLTVSGRGGVAGWGTSQ